MPVVYEDPDGSGLSGWVGCDWCGWCTTVPHEDDSQRVAEAHAAGHEGGSGHTVAVLPLSKVNRARDIAPWLRVSVDERREARMVVFRDLWGTGVTLEGIAREMGVGICAARNVRKASGVSPRHGGRPRREAA